MNLLKNTNIIFALELCFLIFIQCQSRETPYTLTYFGFRGRGEFIRLILEYKKIEYEMKMITFQDWPGLKNTLPPAGTLPFIEIEGHKYGQSHAIARYLGDAHDMTGNTKLEKLHLDGIVGVYDDVFIQIVEVLKMSMVNPKKSIKKFKEVNNKWCDYYLPIFEKLFNKHNSIKGYILEDNLTWADFWMYEAFDVHLIISPECLDPYPRLKLFYETMDSLPELEYAKSTRLSLHPLLLKLLTKIQ